MSNARSQLEVRAKGLPVRAEGAPSMRLGFAGCIVTLLIVGLQGSNPVAGLTILGLACFLSAAWTHRSLPSTSRASFRLRSAGDDALAKGAYEDARVLYLRALAAAQRETSCTRDDLLLHHYGLAVVHALLKHHVEASAHLSALLEGFRGRVPVAWYGHVSWLMRKVAHQQSLAGKHADAIDLCRRALALVGDAPGADDCTIRSLVDDLAWLHHHAGDYEQAELLFRQALEIHERYLSAVLDSHLRRPEMAPSERESPYRAAGPAVSSSGGLERAVAYSLLGLGWTLFERGRVLAARDAFERASFVSYGVRASGGDEVATKLAIEVLRGRAAAEMTLGRYEEAAGLYERARSLAAGRDPMRHLALSIDLGWLARCQERFDEADSIYAALLRELEGQGEERGTLACAVHESVADLRRRQGRLREAAKESERALALAQRCLGSEHPRYAAILATTARVLAARCEYAEADRRARAALRILRLSFGPEHPRLADGYVALGEVHLARGQFGAAEQALLRALRLREMVYGTEHPELAEVLEAKISVLRATDRHGEAELLTARAQRLRKMAVAA